MVGRLKQLQFSPMAAQEDYSALMAAFNTPKPELNKKIRSKKQSYLLKFQLFAVIFQKKGQSNFNEIVENVEMKYYEFGFGLYSQPQERTFNFIVKGAVMLFVQKTDDLAARPSMHQRLGPESHFGEKSMYGANLKLHSVKSVSPTYVLTLDLQTFYKTFSGHFKYKQLKEKVDYLKTIWFFASTSRNQIERILLLSKPTRYLKNAVLFKPGDSPSHVYVVISGEVTLFNQGTPGPFKYQPFLLLGPGQICGHSEVLSSSNFQYGAMCSAAETVLLKINEHLFKDIFDSRADQLFLKENSQIQKELKQTKNEKLLRASTGQLFSKLAPHTGQAGHVPPQSQRKRLSLRTQESLSSRRPKSLKSESVFDIGETKLTKENLLKDQNMRDLTKAKIKQKQIALDQTVRLSSYTNWSFTSDKQLLFNYLIRKEKKERLVEVLEDKFRKQRSHQIGLQGERSVAVRNHKRKIKNSRRAGSMSVPHINS